MPLPEENPLAAVPSVGPADLRSHPGDGSCLVQLYLRLTVAPDRVQDTVQAMRAVMAPARLHVDCAGVRLTADVENPTVLVYAEDWLALDALTREFHSPRFTRLMEMMESSTEPPALEIRFVSEVRGQAYVEAQWAR